MDGIVEKESRILTPFKRFIDLSSSGGILLVSAAFISLIIMNSSLANAYDSFWHMKLSIQFGIFKLSKSLLHWINDGLMAIFFLNVGLEIKRELMVGELSTKEKALLPMIAALGGMIVPALIFIIFNFHGNGSNGWGIPMATDIAFALGILALLGKKVPISLKVFLTSLAIVDDIGAILVIAIFYTENILWKYLFYAVLVLVFLFLINKISIRNPVFYLVPGVILWFFFIKSGVHATISGVLLAIFIPAKSRISTKTFLKKEKKIIKEIETMERKEQPSIISDPHKKNLRKLEEVHKKLETPMQRLEGKLEPWVLYLIMPIFALANAGVKLEGNFYSILTNKINLGIILGLVIGKQLGIFGTSFLAVKTGLTKLPENISWKQIYGVSLLAGIGFTMSLFISNLAFQDAEQINSAKTGILIASLISGTIGWIILNKFVNSTNQ